MNKEQIEKIVSAALETNVDGLDMSAEKMDDSLEELGVDSLDVMLIMMDIQEKTGVPIGDDNVEDLDTPNKIVNLIMQG